jgi:hypothetical protein
MWTPNEFVDANLCETTGAGSHFARAIPTRKARRFDIATPKKPRTRQGQPKKYISAQRDMMYLKGGPFCFLIPK